MARIPLSPGPCGFWNRNKYSYDPAYKTLKRTSRKWRRTLRTSPMTRTTVRARPAKVPNLYYAGSRLKQYFERLCRDKKIPLQMAVINFHTQFPECGFVRSGSWGPDRPGNVRKNDDRLRLIAILAISCRYQKPDAGRQIHHVAMVTRELGRRIAAPPTLSLIQSFLVMAIYKWGEGAFHSASVYLSIATGMVQAYRGTWAESDEEITTMWTYFVVDKLLSCGRQRPTMTSAMDIQIPLPGSNSREIVTMGEEPGRAVTFRDLIPSSFLPRKMSQPNFYFCIFVRGFDIWHQIHSWVMEGDKNKPRISDPKQFPWKGTSKWAKLNKQLSRWRKDQDPGLKYPEVSVASHTGGEKTTFGYINLLYYLCIVHLRREYIPVLLPPIIKPDPDEPASGSTHTGVRPGWWRENADILFEAVMNISHLMRELNECRGVLHTPFTGLCVYTAALMNKYASKLPHMRDYDEQALRKQLAAENLADLKKVAKYWKLGQEWVKEVNSAEDMYGSDHSCAIHRL